MTAHPESRRARARSWFESLQEQICAAIESLESEAPARAGEPARGPARFERTAWTRADASGAPGGGGRAAILRGRLFEKAGVHASTVFGAFAPEFASQIPGADGDPRFWASGVSVILHPVSPHVPTVHMNTRYVETTRAWFGGGADLTPMLERRRRRDDVDSLAFHDEMKRACEAHSSVASYERFSAWCDDYFFLKHRNEPRGIGGVFFDYLDSAATGGPGFDADFAFVRAIGEAFLAAYPQIVRRNWDAPWTAKDRDEQLARRGRYVEFNLIYDRGTIFGLKTGGNVESILSSLPPLATWP